MDTNELKERLTRLVQAVDQLNAPDIDWIMPRTETDENILTEIGYELGLAKVALSRAEAKHLTQTAPDPQPAPEASLQDR